MPLQHALDDLEERQLAQCHGGRQLLDLDQAVGFAECVLQQRQQCASQRVEWPPAGAQRDDQPVAFALQRGQEASEDHRRLA